MTEYTSVSGEFLSEGSHDIENTSQSATEENEVNTTCLEIPGVQQSRDKPSEKCRNKDKRMGFKNMFGSGKRDEELSAEGLEKHIPRKKKQIKMTKKELFSKLRERTEEREILIESKDHVIEAFVNKNRILSQQRDEKVAEAKELKDKLSLEKLDKDFSLLKEKKKRFRVEELLRQARSVRAELEKSLEEKRQDAIEKSRLLQQERKRKTELEELVQNLQIQLETERNDAVLLLQHFEEERNRRIATERELTDERISLQQDRENLERERETYEQRIRDSERTVIESEHRLQELQSAVTTAQEALAENRRLQPRDWIIGREEVILSERSLGVGAWGKVYKGTFRGCKVAVKQIHDLILSPHNCRLFEREMSIASRCRHPNLLQFIGATNEYGNPLFITELLDTDLRKLLTQRALHYEEIICLALDVAKGLNYLHLNKPFPIIHRDVSSSNVLLWRRDNCWRAKLSDYGAANFMRQHMSCNPGASIYAAPESQTSRQSPKADVYSFGLLLCEMCIRELPVPQQVQDQISLVNKGVLRELIMRCVTKAPEARPSMNDVIFVLTH